MPSAAWWGCLSLPLRLGHLRMAGDVPMGGRRPQEDEDAEDASLPLQQAREVRWKGESRAFNVS